jgi:thiol-disulfide isomerase/thioredoxin
MKYLLIAILLLACSVPALTVGETVKIVQPPKKLAPSLPGEKIPDPAGKVGLVDFWASWRVLCKASFPALNRLQSQYAAKGLVISGVGVDDSAADFKKFSTTMGASFPLVHDAAHRAAGAFNPVTMPASYLIDRKGDVRHIHTGFKGAKTEQEYTKEIEALLGESL